MAIIKGKPCKRGHDGRRYSSGGGCVQCSLDTSKRQASTPEGREKKRLAYWKEGGREDRRARNLQANYGISIEQYEAMVAHQAYGCAICGGEAGGSAKRFHVDHDHSTGQIRELLCHKCNVGLGSFQDSPQLLEAAIEYLRRFGKI